MVSTTGEIFFKSLRTFLKPILSLWEDKQVSEIHIHSAQGVWAEKMGLLEKVDVLFPEDELTQTVRKVGQLFGVLVNEENPFLNKSLVDGTEISLFLPPLTPVGPVLVIRKPHMTMASCSELCHSGFLTPPVADFLRCALLAQQSMLLVGATGTDVSKLLQALVRALPTEDRIVHIQFGSRSLLEHPRLLSLDFNSLPTKDESRNLHQLFPAIVMLRPQRLVVENLGCMDTQTLLPWLSDGYPGSLATLRAHHIQHAMQVLEMYGTQRHEQISLSNVRTQIVSAFSLVVACRRDFSGRSYVDEISEILPLSVEGLYRFLPLFRRQKIETTSSVRAEGHNPSSGVLLPVGHIPSFWPHIRHFEQNMLDRSFFHPANYNELGHRVAEKAIPSMAPIGVPMEESDDMEARPRTSKERGFSDADFPPQTRSVFFEQPSLSKDAGGTVGSVSRKSVALPLAESNHSAPNANNATYSQEKRANISEPDTRHVDVESISAPESQRSSGKKHAVEIAKSSERANTNPELGSEQAKRVAKPTEPLREKSEDAESTMLEWGTPEPPSSKRIPEPKNNDDVVTEPGRNLQELMAETDPPSVFVTIPPAFAAPDVEEDSTKDTNSLSKDESHSILFGMDLTSLGVEKLPTKISSQLSFSSNITSSTEATLTPGTLSAGEATLTPGATSNRSHQLASVGATSLSASQGVPDKPLFSVPGRTKSEPELKVGESSDLSSILTVSRTTPLREKVDGISTAPHVPVDMELMAIANAEPINDSHQILDLADVIADESPSIVSEEDLRWVEQELRRPSPIQLREQSTTMLPNPAAITEVVTRERVISQVPPSANPSNALPSEDLYTDPEDTFRQGKTPLLFADQTRGSSRTEPETESVPDVDKTFHPSRELQQASHPSVMVRRGSRQAPPSMPTARIEHESTSIRGQSPVRMPPPSSPSLTGLPDNRPENRPTSSDSRPAGIRPPASPPPAISVAPSKNPAQQEANDATLIRERRPPRFKS